MKLKTLKSRAGPAYCGTISAFREVKKEGVFVGLRSKDEKMPCRQNKRVVPSLSKNVGKIWTTLVDPMGKEGKNEGRQRKKKKTSGVSKGKVAKKWRKRRKSNGENILRIRLIRRDKFPGRGTAVKEKKRRKHAEKKRKGRCA